MKTYVLPILKALVAGASAFLASLITALGDNAISTQEWLTAALVALGAAGAVWITPNLKQQPPGPGA